MAREWMDSDELSRIQTGQDHLAGHGQGKGVKTCSFSSGTSNL